MPIDVSPREESHHSSGPTGESEERGQRGERSRSEAPQSEVSQSRCMHRTRLTKPDGRAMWLYSRRPIDPGIRATNPNHDPVTNRPHLRWHPLREEWVSYASHRQGRTFLPPKEYNPLAPTASDDFPTELPPGDYDVAVFENLFSSLAPDVDIETPPGSEQVPSLYVPTQAGFGACEVVVFTQSAEGSLGQLPLTHVELLLRAWADRTREIGSRPGIDYVMPFENRGVEVGVTLHHPHGQIYAYPYVPAVPRTLAESQERYLKENGTGLLADMIESERRDGARMLFDDGRTAAFVPACARYPYEVWIAPVRQVGSLHEMSDEEISSFARGLKTILLKYDGLWSRPFPYLMVLYQKPTDGKGYPGFHFHITFSPPYRSKDRLKFLAGTELGAGMFVNDALPEEKARELKEVEVDIT